MKKVFCFAVLVLVAFNMPANALNNKITNTFRNTTGKPADDLHITVNTTWNVIVNPPAPTSNVFTGIVAPNGGTTIDLSNGIVPNGGTATVNYTVDDLLWITGKSIDRFNTYWTSNGENIGLAGTTTVDVTTTDNGDGTYTTVLDNLTGGVLDYTNAILYTGIDIAYFNNDDYLDQMITGTAVSLDIGSSGTFANGSTTITTFTPLMEGYTAIAFNFGPDNDIFGIGSAIPEPVTVLLLGLGGLFIRRRKKA